MAIYVGIDPGKSGGIAWVRDNFGAPEFVKADGMTEMDLYAVLQGLTCEAAQEHTEIYAVIERVSSSPQMGVTSAFSFGRDYGTYLGLLAGCAIPFALVTPQKWQKAMGCLSKGNKNVTKAAAQRLYPSLKITHATADSLLLATYCRKHCRELFGLAPSAGEG